MGAMTLLQHQANLIETLAVLRRKMMRQYNYRVHTESAVNEMEQGDVKLSTTHENLVDVNGAVPDSGDGGTSSYLHQGQDETLSISEFFARPVEIANFTIADGALISNSYEVWNLYTLDPTVRAKLRNYAYLHGTLKLRVVISGTQFHYGRAMIAYEPYAIRNKNISVHETNLIVFPTTARSLFINYLSQSAGSKTVDYKNNRPLDFTCPFISTKNEHRLYNSAATVISAVTSFDDLAAAGRLYFYSINPLATASTVATDVSVQIYAWMEGIQLGCTTATQVAITTESKEYVGDGMDNYYEDPYTFTYDALSDISCECCKRDILEWRACLCDCIWCELDVDCRQCTLHTPMLYRDVHTESDERKVGPVERMASSMAFASGVLEQIPYIQPYAMASTQIFNSISGLAAWFGWSRPAMDTVPNFVKNEPFRNGAQVIGGETVKRISVDPKQELTVDPRIMGVDNDELVIVNLSSIESYLTQFAWSSSDSRLAAPIFLSKVTPQLDSWFEAKTTTVVQPTAMSFVALPFDYWHGTIEFRFEIVASNFHRGKLVVGYEPNIAQAALINTTIELNKNFLYIIDIQETQSVSLCAEWAQPRAWSCIMDKNLTKTNYGSRFDPALNQNCVNGYIFVTPFTELTSPDGSAVTVNVYVRCKDLMLQQPTSTHMPLIRDIVTESGDYHDSKYDGDVGCYSLVKSSVRKDGMAMHHFGEQPVSFRSLLKRYTTTHLRDAGVSGTTFRTLRFIGNCIPSPYPAYGSGAIVTLAPSLCQYLGYAFLGVRGGVRKRFHARGWTSGASIENQMGSTNRTSVTLLERAGTAAGSATWVASDVLCDFKATVSFVPHTNGGIEFEVPFYSNNLFAFSFADDFVGTNATGDMEPNWSRQFSIDTEVDHREAAVYTCTLESAAGEDFTYFRYCGAPMYTYTT